MSSAIPAAWWGSGADNQWRANEATISPSNLKNIPTVLEHGISFDTGRVAFERAEYTCLARSIHFRQSRRCPSWARLADQEFFIDRAAEAGGPRADMNHCIIEA